MAKHQSESAILERIDFHWEALLERGYKPIYIGLAGSQNYDLDTPTSDVDTKAIVLPTSKDLITGAQMVSCTVKLNDGEQCDVKDIRMMMNSWFKQNINFLEILFTEYFLYDEGYADFLSELRALRERIAHIDKSKAIKCMAGLAYNKVKHMEHISPASKQAIEQFGYDPKQLHHVCRIREFAQRYIEGETFEECLKSKHVPFLLKVKNGEIGLNEARALASANLAQVDYAVENLPQMGGSFQAIDTDCIELVKNYVYCCIEKKLRRELS